jgi:hypothetical protein
MRRVRWLVGIAAVAVGGVALTRIAANGLSLLLGSLVLVALIAAVLALCGRLPGQSFFGDDSPTRAHDSLHYP